MAASSRCSVDSNMTDYPVVFLPPSGWMWARQLGRCCPLLLQGGVSLSPGGANSAGRALSRRGSAMGESTADPKVWGRSHRSIRGNSRSSLYYEATSSLEACEVGDEAAAPGRCIQQACSALGSCMQHPT